MSRRRSTSPFGNYQNPGDPTQNNTNIRSTAELYKQAYQSLMDVDCRHDNPQQHTSTRNNNLTIPPPHRNNLKPIDSPIHSPLRRPHSSSENDMSGVDEFDNDPNTKTIQKHRKKSKTNNNNDNTTISLNVNRPRSPTTTNLIPQQLNITNEPICPYATTNQHIITNPSPNVKLTDEAKSFAQSRYPFSPFILRFSIPHIHDQKIVNELCNYLKEIKNLTLELSGYRKSSSKCEPNECDLLLFVKNSNSFAILYDQSNWPQTITGLSYSRPSTPSLPPQLSLIIKNVNLSIEFNDFTNEIKSAYPNVQNVIRMKNRYQSSIKLVKLEFSQPNQREEILKQGKVFVHSLSYDVEEYLAPARVLICSKCMGLGHFRKQCKQLHDTCSKCGQAHDDIKNHTPSCSNLICIHCNGNHMSNDMKCPVIKQFRSDLTKCLLSPAMQVNQQNSHSNMNSSNFPPLTTAQRHLLFNSNTKFNHWSTNTPPSNAIVNKIDTLINSMNQVNHMLEKITEKNNRLERFINEKTLKDEIISKKVDDLININNNYKLNIAKHEIMITRHENIFTKLIFPILEEISSFLSNINMGKHNGTLDADFKVKINRMRTQLNNAQINKDF